MFSAAQQQMMGDFEPADTKPFSIRQYVLAARREDIFHCWPFSVKYLQLCMNKHGVNNVLPPLEPRDSATRSLSNIACSSCYQEDKHNNCTSFDNKKAIIKNVEITTSDTSLCSREVTPEVSVKEHKCLTSNKVSNPIIQSTRATLSSCSSVDHMINNVKFRGGTKWFTGKRRSCKRKHKKRSMMEILGTAKHCTLEYLYHE